MILKLIAYDDRPTQRVKDIADINSICHYYPWLESNFIWDNHSDLSDDNLEHEDMGIIVLGREMKKLVSENRELKERLVRIMNKALSEQSPFLTLMIEDSETESIASKRSIIENLKIGFTE